MDNSQKQEGEKTVPEEGFSQQSPSEHGQSAVPETETPESAPATHAEAVPGSTNNKKSNGKLVYAVIIAIIAAILFGAYLYVTKYAANQNTGDNLAAGGAAAGSDITELLDLEKTETVARVNGEALSWNKYKQSLNEVLQNTSAAGADVSKPETKSQIKQQALASLINTELLVQAAHAEGISATESEVQSEYDTIQQQLGGEEKLDSTLAQFDLTREGLRSSISEQIEISAYINEKVSTSTIQVTEEEVQELYDQAAAGSQGGQLPPLEQVRSTIESQIRSSKQQQQVATLIETLRADAEIETMI